MSLYTLPHFYNLYSSTTSSIKYKSLLVFVEFKGAVAQDYRSSASRQTMLRGWRNSWRIQKLIKSSSAFWVTVMRSMLMRLRVMKICGSGSDPFPMAYGVKIHKSVFILMRLRLQQGKNAPNLIFLSLCLFHFLKSWYTIQNYIYPNVES
jgi:hypothetical protein